MLIAVLANQEPAALRTYLSAQLNLTTSTAISLLQRAYFSTLKTECTCHCTVERWLEHHVYAAPVASASRDVSQGLFCALLMYALEFSMLQYVSVTLDAEFSKGINVEVAVAQVSPQSLQ